MAKPPRQNRPDPLAREVDRLLASLKGALREPEHASQPPPDATVRRRTYVGGSRALHPSTRRERIALWAEVALGIALGAAMTQWPYGHACDLPLAAYLGAVTAVLLAAGWVTLASWRLHSGAAHILSLALLFWGTLLVAAQLLPRVGYAAERATWSCSAGVR
jgi:hypothetical protein